ncbi:hypothetical protein GGS23DRAFT_599255 [Durotheca rogersii]|uniref:uncharacterized protein n=1 Tax=Durotheca rogersii TaxID=419775 RepID=UPI00221F177F|nr:uncharacterized protein GGS23DRAFT_599255 [Durotheca rogersii]KAI5860739.1 hypothetical protein GGS23DRAFT_599255 [Durotheca rogersii]
MQFTSLTVALVSFLAGTALAAPARDREASPFEGQPCSRRQFSGFCRFDGRCGLQIPPNETSFVFVKGQCGI